MTSGLHSLVNELFSSIVSAAGTDIYSKVRAAVVRVLGRYTDPAKLGASLDETRRRLLNDEARYLKSEKEKWVRWLEDVEASGVEVSEFHKLEMEIHAISVSQSQRQNQGQSVYVTTILSAGQAESQLRTDAEFGELNDGEDYPGTESGSPSSYAKPLLAAGVIVVVIILTIIANSGPGASSGSHQSDAFPRHTGHWPNGATRDAVLKPVVDRLTACAQEPILAPINCPQNQSDGDSSSVSGVRWMLDGSAADGAVIAYTNKQFEVAGNAIMSVSFSDSAGAEFDIHLIHYHAWVDWNSGSPNLISIIPFGGGTPPRINKRQPSIDWSSIQSAILSEFKQCALSSAAPLPPQCPTTSDSNIDGSHAQWQLDNNPVLNAQESFNRHWGYFDVTGTFSMSASYSVFLLGRQQGMEAGNYDAIVTLNGTQISVLQIIGQ